MHVCVSVVFVCVCVWWTDLRHLSLMRPQHSAQHRVHNNMQLLLISTKDRHTTSKETVNLH